MAKRKGKPRTQQHEWLPPTDGQVTCRKCGMTVSVMVARRGVGRCGNEMPPEPKRQSIPVTLGIKAELGVCHGCGKEIKSVPFNSRLNMICCVNRKCGLYRERLRTEVVR